MSNRLIIVESLILLCITPARNVKKMLSLINIHKEKELDVSIVVTESGLRIDPEM